MTTLAGAEGVCCLIRPLAWLLLLLPPLLLLSQNTGPEDHVQHHQAADG